MGGYRLVVMVHLLGAAVWIGGHLVLSLSVLPRALRTGNPALVRDFESVYERVGLPALALQIITGLWLAHHWGPTAASWTPPYTPQVIFIFVKLGLLALTVALAIHSRLGIMPRLDESTLPLLATHVVAVTILGVAFLVFGVGVRTGGLF
jgi:putative copper export protein